MVFHNLLGDNPGFASKVLYHVMSTLHTFADPAFELVLDVTAMQDSNVPDVSTAGGHCLPVCDMVCPLPLPLPLQLDTMVQFAVFVPELAMSQLEVVYLFNCNAHFRSFANKLPYRIFSHIKVPTDTPMPPCYSLCKVSPLPPAPSPSCAGLKEVGGH